MAYKPLYPHVAKREVLPPTVTGPTSLKQYGRERYEASIRERIRERISIAASSVNTALSNAQVIRDRQLAGDLSRLRQDLQRVQENLK